MSLDRIGDVLSQQARESGSVTRYQGRGPVGADPKLNKLKQLLAQLKALLNSFPPQIAAMLASVIADCEAILLAGGPPEAIGAMINKLEKIIAILMQLLAELTLADGRMALDALTAFLNGMAANMDVAQKSALQKMIRALRRAILEGSLKGMDEASWDEEGFGDGSAPVEPNPQNVIQSLQALVALALSPATTAGNRSTGQ